MTPRALSWLFALPIRVAQGEMMLCFPAFLLPSSCKVPSYLAAEDQIRCIIIHQVAGRPSFSARQLGTVQVRRSFRITVRDCYNNGYCCGR